MDSFLHSAQDEFVRYEGAWEVEADGGGVPFWWPRKPYHRSAHAILTDAKVMQATFLLRSPLERFFEVLYVCDIGVKQRGARFSAV